jgi:hypothetical protein
MVKNVMKTPTNKVLKGFRLSEEIIAELRGRSEATGISETRIVEDALRFHFAQNMVEQLHKVADGLTRKGKKGPFEKPLIPYISNGVLTIG